MKLTYVYIASCSHSGTTLLSKCMGAQPSVLTLGEFKHFASYVTEDKECGCGEPVQSCSFWKQILNDLEVDPTTLVQTHPTDGLRSASWKDRLYSFALLFAPLLRIWEQFPKSLAAQNLQHARNHWAFACATARHSGSDVIVDKSMSISRFLELYWTCPASVQLLLVHNVRDGRGTTDSLMRAHNFSVAEAACRWYQINRRIELVKALFRSVPVRTSHYEQLCRTPVDVVDALLFPTGVSAQPDTELTENLDHGVGGNTGAFHGYDSIRLDQRWKRNLSSSALDMFTAIAGALNRRYGYDRRS